MKNFQVDLSGAIIQECSGTILSLRDTILSFMADGGVTRTSKVFVYEDRVDIVPVSRRVTFWTISMGSLKTETGKITGKSTATTVGTIQ